MLSRVFTRSTSLARSTPSKVFVARISNGRPTTTKPTPSPSPDPDFNTFVPAGSQPIYPTTEWKNPLKEDSFINSPHECIHLQNTRLNYFDYEDNPLQDNGVRANVSQEALDSVFPPSKDLPITKDTNK